MPSIPRDDNFDSSHALLADPYRYISSRCRHHGADLFEARIMMRPTICMTGPRAAELFYAPDAAPEPLRATLFGKGGVASGRGRRTAGPAGGPGPPGFRMGRLPFCQGQAGHAGPVWHKS